MPETPRVRVITRKGEVQTPQDFNFSREMVRLPENNQALRNYRLAAWNHFLQLPLPTVKEEAWRRTDLKGFNPGIFQLNSGKSNGSATLSHSDHYIDDKKSAGGYIFFDAAHSEVFLSENLIQQGVVFTDLITAEQKYPDLLEKILGKGVQPDESRFAAMTAALAQTGFLLYIPKNVSLDAPLHYVFSCSEGEKAFLSHNLVYIDQGASATLVYESTSSEGNTGQVLFSGIVEIYVGPNAKLNFVEIQSLGQNVWNFSHEKALVDQDAELDWIIGASGSKLTKTFTTIDLVGKGSTGKMSGFYFSDRQQHLDYDTQQNHLSQKTTSNLLFKGALLDSSRVVWQGMIYVAPGADDTDGYQENRNLVLSPDARADSLPGLEILADAVRCSHGATVGKIDTDQVFYLLSRGIPQNTAERLIVEGFFEPIFSRIPFENYRKKFQEVIQKKMSHYQP